MGAQCGPKLSEKGYSSENPPNLKQISRRLFELQLTYATAEDEEAEQKLKNWVTRCVYKFFELPYYVPNLTFKYKNSRIEFLVKQGLFSVIKTELNDEGFPSGILYDVAINLKSHLKQLYGTSDIRSLKKTLTYTAKDYDELSEAVAEDLINWCNNITTVFSMNLGTKP